MEKQLIRKKRRARRLALQALYQWLMSSHEICEIEAQFRVANNMEKVDAEYFCQILYGVPKYLSLLESRVIPHLDRPIQSLNPIELSVIRLGAYELLYCPQVPYRIVLDECISMTKEYGSQDGHRYVNGVLNNLAKEVRTMEN